MMLIKIYYANVLFYEPIIQIHYTINVPDRLITLYEIDRAGGLLFREEKKYLNDHVFDLVLL